jgi:hypothetical protein
MDLQFPVVALHALHVQPLGPSMHPRFPVVPALHSMRILTMTTQTLKRAPHLVRSRIRLYFSLCVHSPLTQDVDDAIPGARASRNNRSRMNERPRSSSFQSSSYGNPSAKIWGLYLSQAEKIDKEHSETWSENTNGVLVFVSRFLST